MNKKGKSTQGLTDRATQLVAGFVGSWWAIAVHVIWFSCWLIFGLEVEQLTLWVSLEAIFICILLLIAANKEEAERRVSEERVRQQQMQGLREDLSLDEEARQHLIELRTLVKDLKTDLEKVKGKLD
jgi:uncharacterized membrane protein